MDSIFENQRQTHEEIERLQRALSTVLSHSYPTQQAHIANQHKAAQLLERIVARVHELNSLYEDDDGRKAELNALSAPVAAPGSDDLAEFYTRLGRTREHHMKYPDSVVGAFEAELATLVEEPLAGEYEDEDPLSVMFSGEEAYGRYLDLHSNYIAYTNLKHLRRRPTYLQYLDLLLAVSQTPVHTELPMEARQTKEYEAYLQSLHAYVLSFTKRTRPLNEVDKEQLAAEVEFGSMWDAGQVPDWQDAKKQNGTANGEAGIWCAPCQKMYSKQTVYDAHLTSKKHLKAAARQQEGDKQPSNSNGSAPDSNAASNTHTQQSKNRRLALLTHLTTALLRPLSSTLAETRSNVERRFALTAREREQELLDASTSATTATAAPDSGAAPPAEDEPEEEKIYNPLRLPLGWDGKPIPYWLYKLHGLGVEYRCEICSDHVYMGRKNFDRHFQESRHAFGMRALGLPNTKHFHEITRIEDALALAERLKQEGRQELVQNETTEELEDEDGNVYNRKTYEDLKKQGIIR